MKNMNTDNVEDSSTRRETHPEKTVPSSITVNVPSRREFAGEEVSGPGAIPKGLLAVLVTMGLALVAGVITLAVLLITQPNARAAVGPAPAPSQTVEPSSAPSPTPTPVPTTAPEQTDDFSSILEAPENEILSQDQ